jgi:glycosyltransferase involved in cell wall biosynthesis
MKMRRVCLVPKLNGVGGMAAFQAKLAAGLTRRGVEVSMDLAERPCAAVLVIGGTRKLRGLWQARRSGARIVHRLDGMNWLHRRRRTGIRHFLRSEYGNLLLEFIRTRLADAVVYQSEFARKWWEGAKGPARAPARVIYNGVDLGRYSPSGEHQRPEDRYRLLIVEGNLGGGYETGLESAVGLAEQVALLVSLPVELMVVGKASRTLQESWRRQASIPVEFTGQVSPERIPAVDRSAHLLYSADIQAACPNSVIEALACGLPVAAFDTGALAELVQDDAGRVVPYGGDAWRLDPPDLPALARAAAEILAAPGRFRPAARKRAEEAFGMEEMVDRYLESLLE